MISIAAIDKEVKPQGKYWCAGCETYIDLPHTHDPKTQAISEGVFPQWFLDSPEGQDLLAISIGLKWRTYKDYLSSAWWSQKAAEVKDRDGNRCRICNSDKRIAVHHRTYERIGREKDEDVLTLCETCHSLFHEHGRLSQ